MYAAATLTITGGSIASNGKSITATTNCIVSCSPTTGITGISIISTNSTYASLDTIGTITASGTTLTIPVSVILLSTDVVTLNILTVTNSNLTDTLTNTPLGQTGVSITNNSTVTGSIFANGNANLFQLGYWINSDPGLGHQIRQQAGNASVWEFNVTTTDLDLDVVSAFGGSVVATVDGVTTTITPLYTASGSALSWVPIISGGTNTTHLVILQPNGGGSIYFDAVNSLRAAGTGLVSPPSYLTNQTIISPTNTGSGFIRTDGSPYILANTNGYPSIVSCTGNTTRSAGDCVIRFVAKVSDISIWAYAGDVGSFSVYTDGVLTNTLSHGADNFFTMYHIAVGLNPSATHTFTIVDSSPDSFNLYYALILAGSSGLVTSSIPAKLTWGWYGDSIVQLDQGGLTDMTQGDPWLVTQAFGTADYRLGIGGACVYTGASCNGELSTTPYIANMTNLSPYLGVILSEGAVNDQIQGLSVPSFQTAKQNEITTLANGSSTVIVRELLPNSTTNSGNRGSFGTATLAAVNAATAACVGGCTAKYIYVNTDNWVNTTTDLAGGLHPNATGYAKIYNQELPVFGAVALGYSYTVSCPAIAGVNVAITCTATVVQGGKWSSDNSQTFSPSSSGATFSPTVPIAGTNANVSTSFTVKWASAGVKTLSFSNGNSGWLDPGSLSVTVKASGGNFFLLF